MLSIIRSGSDDAGSAVDVEFVTGGNVKVLEKWLEDKCEMPIDEFVADLMEHTPRDYYEYLE